MRRNGRHIRDGFLARTFLSAGLYISVFGLSFNTGCGTPEGEIFAPLESPPVWPEPPEQGRIRYVGMLSTEQDLKPAVSWTEGLGQLIFGKQEMGVMIGPYAVVSDRNNRLLVADAPSGVIHVFDFSSRTYSQLESLDDGETLMMPIALTEVDGNIYVADSALHRICVFDKKGRFKFAFGTGQLKRPSGIAYWQLKEKVYVSDAARHVIDVFDKSGGFLRKIGSRGSEAGEFNFPTHLWVDNRSGKLYVSDTLNYRVQVFSCDGRFLRMFGKHGDRPGCFAHPSGIATDSSGHVYVIDRQFENVQIFDSDGRILMAFGEEGGELGQFWLPAGLYIDERDRIYVADSFNKRVQVFELLEVLGNEN
jgi:DNA-binding beta-propeller fold protein YncE